MKKKLLVFMLTLICILGATCFAQGAPRNPNSIPLPRERMALGGLHVGDTMDYVQSIYGEPDSQQIESNPKVDDEYAIWNYGDSVVVQFTRTSPENDFHIQAIHVTADNGFETPDGIKIGSNFKDLMKVYGKAVNQTDSKAKDGKYRYNDDKTGFIQFIFYIKNGKVFRISLGYNN